MSIVALTSYPSSLLESIRRGIREKRVEGWISQGGGDFTYAEAEWRDLAAFHAIMQPEKLILGLIGSQDIIMTKRLYSFYHARFIEMLLANFDTEFTDVLATAHKDVRYDRFQ